MSSILYVMISVVGGLVWKFLPVKTIIRSGFGYIWTRHADTIWHNPFVSRLLAQFNQYVLPMLCTVLHGLKYGYNCIAPTSPDAPVIPNNNGDPQHVNSISSESSVHSAGRIRTRSVLTRILHYVMFWVPIDTPSSTEMTMHQKGVHAYCTYHALAFVALTMKHVILQYRHVTDPANEEYYMYSYGASQRIVIFESMVSAYTDFSFLGGIVSLPSIIGRLIPTHGFLMEDVIFILVFIGFAGASMAGIIYLERRVRISYENKKKKLS